MTELLQQEINEAIEKNLPSQVSDVLRSRLALCDELEQRQAEAERHIEELEKTAKEQRREIALAGDLLKRETAVAERGAAVEKRERKQAIFALEQKLQAAETINERTHDYVRLLMRNMEFRKDVLAQPASYDSQGVAHYGAPSTVETAK